MKHIVHIAGRQFTIPTELDVTHCIIGRRDRSKEAVEAPVPLKSGFTPEQKEAFDKALVARKLFVSKDTAGRYSMKPLEWVEGEEVANREAQVWKDEGWLDVSVIPVETNLPNA